MSRCVTELYAGGQPWDDQQYQGPPVNDSYPDEGIYNNEDDYMEPDYQEEEPPMRIEDLLSDPEETVRIKDKPGHTMILGIPQTGKTEFLRYYCFINRKKFHRFKVICPTADVQTAYNFL